MPTLAIEQPDGTVKVLYEALPHQVPYHESTLPNLIMVGPRGTGKSVCARYDAHMRAMQVPRFRYLIMRRTMPELKRSHLQYVNDEMRQLGGDFHNTDSIARYPNGSLGYYGHCDSPNDTMKYLSSEYDLVIADEITTFTGDLILKMASCARVPRDSGRVAMFRGGTNPLGIGAEFVRKYFVDKNVSAEENPDYLPDEWGILTHKLSDNTYLDVDQYRKRLQALPEHVRRAWLEGEWVVEGAYFTDFRPFKDGEPWHVISQAPTWATPQGRISVLSAPWVNIYRAIDWGYAPDPAVCLWIAVLPNKRAIVFKERHWKETLAADVAQQIKRASEGMRVVETFCDPTMMINDGKGAYGIGEIFEQHGVPLTPSTNKRDLYGYAIHNYLNTLIDAGDGSGPAPQLQIMAESGIYGAPNLIRTIPSIQIGSPDPNKMANGNDHWVVALAYFAMSQAAPSRDPESTAVGGLRPWQVPKWRRQYAVR
jgi:phage terminase large subunit